MFCSLCPGSLLDNFSTQSRDIFRKTQEPELKDEILRYLTEITVEELRTDLVVMKSNHPKVTPKRQGRLVRVLRSKSCRTTSDGCKDNPDGNVCLFRGLIYYTHAQYLPFSSSFSGFPWVRFYHNKIGEEDTRETDETVTPRSTVSRPKTMTPRSTVPRPTTNGSFFIV